MSELFRSLVLSRRLDDAALRLLESASVSKDVKSSVQVRSGLKRFLRSESLPILGEISDKTVDEKLLVLEFLVRAFALVGDIESCLAFRYEALIFRDLKSTTQPWLEVPYTEWINFAHQSRDCGFYSIAGRACENALVSLKRKSTDDQNTDEAYLKMESHEDQKTHVVIESEKVIESIRRLKSSALTSASSHSVQAQTADYLKKRLKEQSMESSSVSEETKCVASTLFRNGIKRRNLRKLYESRSLAGMADESRPSHV